MNPLWLVLSGLIGIAIGAIGATLTLKARSTQEARTPVAPEVEAVGKAWAEAGNRNPRNQQHNQHQRSKPASEDLNTIMTASQSVVDTLEQRYRNATPKAESDSSGGEQADAGSRPPRSRSRRRPRRRGPRPSSQPSAE